MTLCTKTLFADENEAPSQAEKQEVAEGVANGKVVVFPTDTVYGIGTSGLLPQACERLYALKDRDPRKALPILVHSALDARRWAVFSEAAETLSEKYWPGPLTLVLTPSEEGRSLTSPGTETLAIRVPAHPLTRELIALSGVPWATTSANRSGEAACSDGASAAAAFSGRVEFVVDAGVGGGEASTVVDMTGSEPKILREGAIESGVIFG